MKNRQSGVDVGGPCLSSAMTNPLSSLSVPYIIIFKFIESVVLSYLGALVISPMGKHTPHD
jgi:hypothetical protein